MTKKRPSVVNVMALVLLGFPAYVLGYAWAAIKAGWQTGMFSYDRQEGEACDYFEGKR